MLWKKKRRKSWKLRFALGLLDPEVTRWGYQDSWMFIVFETLWRIDHLTWTFNLLNINVGLLFIEIFPCTNCLPPILTTCSVANRIHFYYKLVELVRSERAWVLSEFSKKPTHVRCAQSRRWLARRNTCQCLYLYGFDIVITLIRVSKFRWICKWLE